MYIMIHAQNYVYRKNYAVLSLNLKIKMNSDLSQLY